MSKKRTVALSAAMIGFLISSAGLAYVNLSAEAENTAGVDASVSHFRFLSVETPDSEATDKKLRFTINRNLGENPFSVTAPALDKVVYTKAAGGTKAATAINYIWDSETYLPKLSFTFEGDGEAVSYAVGDTIEIKAGFTFNNWDGGALNIAYSDNQTVTYTENGWTGEFLDSSLDNIQLATAGKASWTTGSGVTVNFGLSGLEGHQVALDGSWAGQPSVVAWEIMKTYIDYNSSVSSNVYSRSWLTADGRFTVQAADDTLVPVAGDSVILKKGLTLWTYTAEPFLGMVGVSTINYVPALVLNREMAFVYDGEAWSAVNPATSAEIGNKEEVQKLCVNQTVKIEVSANEGAVELPTYITSDSEIATVDKFGAVKGLKAGKVTITAKFAKVSASVEITVGEEPEKTGIQFELPATAAAKEGRRYLVAYKGEAFSLPQKVQAKFTYANGLSGEVFDVTEDVLSTDKFDNTKAGETVVTVTKDGVSADMPVWVYEVQEVDALEAKRVLTWSSAINLWFTDLVAGGETADVKVVNIINNPGYGIPENMVTLRVPAADKSGKTYPLNSIGHTSQKQCLLYFTNFDGMNVNGTIPVGAVLTINENFRFYRNIDETWIAAYKFKESLSFVWTGREWTDFVADTTDVELEETEMTVPKYAKFAPKMTIQPEGSYFAPTMTSDNEEVVAAENGMLVAKAAGTANISIMVGETEKTLKITVEDSDAQGIVVANDRTFYVAENGVFDISKVRVKADYGRGYYGDETALSEETAKFTLDTSETGKRAVSVEVTLTDHGKEIKNTVSVNVEVQKSQEIYPDNLTCLDDNHIFGEAICIYFQKTFSNQANVYLTELSEEEAKTVADNILFEREGKTVTVDSQNFLTYLLVFTPKIDGEAISKYQTGDRITLKKGLSFYRWFGEMDNMNVPVGEGDYVKVGELMYDVTFTYNSNGKFFMEIAPYDGIVKEETVEVGLGQQHASNVTILPEYATEGEWFFTVADDTIASVNTNGLITGKKIGETTVTAVLKKVDGTEIKTLTYKIRVTDAVNGLEITSEKPVELDPGTELDLGVWIKEFGIKGTALLASGGKGGEVDLSGARVTGYDPEKEGEQTLTFRVTVDGKSVTGTLKVQVREKSGSSGCGSSISLAGAALSVAALGTAALAFRRRKDD